MTLLIYIAPILGAVLAILLAAYLLRLAWRLTHARQDRNAQLLNSVYNQQERRRRGES